MRIRQIISDHRKRLLPVLVAFSLLAGIITSIIATPNAQADYTTGCSYGYKSNCPIFQSVVGRPAYMGETRLFVINGKNLADLSVSSNGASVKVVIDAPTQVKVDVTPVYGRAPGVYVLTGRTPYGSASLRYSLRFNLEPLFTKLTGPPAYIGRTTLFTITGHRLAGVKVSSNGAKVVEIVKDTATLLEVNVTPVVGWRPGSYTLTVSDKYGWNTIKYNQLKAKK